MKQFKERASLISSSESLGGAVDDMYMFNPFLIPITAIIGSFVFIIIKTLAKARVRELEIRERIAMIERGLVPPPEVDPRGFDRAMNRSDGLVVIPVAVKFRHAHAAQAQRRHFGSAIA